MERNKGTRLRGSLMLTLTAAIWGSAFVAQSAGMDYVGPFTFNAARSIIGVIALIPAILLLDRVKLTAPPASKAERSKLLRAGFICGVVMFAASMCQQIGIMNTTAGKAGFITALYIVIVPILGLFMRRRVSPLVWISVAAATVGLYLLCAGESFTFGAGDSMVMLCALLFAVHIMVIDRFAPEVDGVRLSCLQFAVSGVLSLVCALIFEAPSFSALWDARVSILYAGVLSSGVAYTLQIIGQGSVEPVLASLLMSLESVFSAFFGWLILKESMTAREIFGSLLIFAAILTAQTAPLIVNGLKTLSRRIKESLIK